MEPQQNQNPIPPQQSAFDYYNKYKKRSFFLSRITVLSSMVVLIVALGINISLLYSHSMNTVASHASAPETTANLPSLPAGCDYQKVKGGFVVICPTATPTPGATVPINVALPQLPPQCTLSSSTNGNGIHCTSAVPIPTVAVTLPPACEVTTQPNILSCNDKNKIIPVPLPSLPGGCSYTFNLNRYYVVCAAK